MKPWETLARAVAPDGERLDLRRRDREFLIRAGGYDLMSSDDDASSKALASLGLQALREAAAHVLVGGLGMGFTLRAALDGVGPDAVVEVVELVDAVVTWNEGPLGEVARHPLRDARTRVTVGDVGARIARAHAQAFDAILLDVDNGPDALAHTHNHALYSSRGLASIHRALSPGGVLGVWSFTDDARFTARCKRAGLWPEVVRVPASRKGRGRFHYVWVARKPGSLL